jgi:NAD(P)-dependent dehydrogenase (short-subunit alcohol dehydrogenase family)
MANAAAGRVALVTGASQGGTGTVAAIRLAAEGAKVAITARSVDGLERTRAEIETLGGTALVLPCDLAARDGGRDTLVARTEAELGPVDILVNNAAAGGYRPLEEWGQDDLDRIMELNLYAPWCSCGRCCPGCASAGGAGS